MQQRLLFAIVVALSCVCARAAAPDESRPVSTRMRNIVFHMGFGVVLHVDDLAGRLVSRSPGRPPAFDDVNGYLVEIDAARVAMDAESLANLMNNYIFSAHDAPLKDLKIAIEGNE